MRPANSLSTERIQTVTSMRGGLGRTLLSAFLLLAIIPLAIISFLAVSWAQRDLRHEVTARLTAIARMKEAEIEVWMTNLTAQLEALAKDPNSRQVFLPLWSTDSSPSLDVKSVAENILESTRRACELEEIALFNADGQLLVATTPQQFSEHASALDSLASARLIKDSETDQPLMILSYPLQDENDRVLGHLVGLAETSTLNAIMTEHTDLGQTGETYLLSSDYGPLTPLRFAAVDNLGQAMRPAGIETALDGQEGENLYTGYQGEPVIGVYRWLPGLQAALIVEQTQAEAFARDDGLATLLVGATLLVALLTTMLAAIITRQLSKPIVQLTLTAVKIAGGDLEQSVPVNRSDEIGILAQAFNIMTSELRASYQDLERKVAERTAQLREANQQLRYQAMQLTLSAEVGRTITSILELDPLLEKIVKLIRNSYSLLRVAIYLLDESGRRVVRQARVGWDGNRCSHTGLRTIHHDSLMGRAVAEGRPNKDSLRTNVAVPLKAGQRVIGVLKLQAYRGDELSETDIRALQNLGDQICVAIQNAQTYDVEKGTVERLHRLDQIRTLSLSNMSRELATSLNSIIGFSRLILKGVDGPLTDQQRSDVGVINRSGQHLQGLLDDILELVDLESGEHPLEPSSVELDEILTEVIEQIAPLAEKKSITLHSKSSADLPLLQADGARLRQVLTYFISNVLETTTAGDAVTVDAWINNDNGSEIMVRIAPDAEIFMPDDGDVITGSLNDLTTKDFVWDGTDSGIKLILSQRIIELHGGRLWGKNGPAKPATFVFTLPVTGVDSHLQEREEDSP